MQHTAKYKFKLIETSDTFSPEALNENARTAETELARVETVHAADKAALEKTVAANKAAADAADAAIRTALGTGGKTARIKWGSYVGNGKIGQTNPNSLDFDFKPHFLFVTSGSSWYNFMLRGVEQSENDGYYPCKVTWGENSVSWYSSENAAYQCNANDSTYYYIAIGESL